MECRKKKEKNIEGEPMTPQENRNPYKKNNTSIADEIDEWAFGVDPDPLA